jgi:VWFA-related protein
VSFSRREFLISAAALAPAARLLAQQDSGATPKYTSDVNVVNVLATVRDKEGKIVSNLTKDDFSIEEDGRPQAIQYFAAQFDSPLKLGLLVDTSGSERRNLEAERRASYKFFDQVMREDRDKAFLIHFDHEVELLEDWTPSREKLDKGLDELSASDDFGGQGRGRGGGGRGRGRGRGGGTMLYDAVYLAADEMMRKEQGRKAVILFSDGDDTGSKETLARAVEAAQRADVLVYSIRFYDANGFGRPTVGIGPVGGRYPRQGRSDQGEGKEVLQRISAETGGGYFEASGSTLDKTFARIQDELRNQYSLGYTSDQHGAGYRLIKVMVKGKNLTVQAREGYYAK